jgi:uncharacterized iron-regulated membrane protein
MLLEAYEALVGALASALPRWREETTVVGLLVPLYFLLLLLAFLAWSAARQVQTRKRVRLEDAPSANGARRSSRRRKAKQGEEGEGGGEEEAEKEEHEEEEQEEEQEQDEQEEEDNDQPEGTPPRRSRVAARRASNRKDEAADAPLSVRKSARKRTTGRLVKSPFRA